VKGSNEMALVSNQLVDFVKSFEGFSATKYRDCVGILTQGFGQTGDEIKNLPAVITEAQATEMLKDLLNNKYAQPIKNDLDRRGIHLNQNQFDSLISFSYNCGIQALLGSTLYRNICNGVRDKAIITNNFTVWSMAG
jgi:lysozyme